MKESAIPANAMGTSSSTAGSGPIDLFDPLLRKQILQRSKKATKTLRKRTEKKKHGKR